jgi:ketosteroid isomerase-like protein
MSRSLDLVMKAVELAQRARASGSEADWDDLASCWADAVEVRVADGRAGGQVWRVTARGRQEARDRLSRPQVAAPKLRTSSVRAFASVDDAIVVVEQISTVTDADGAVVGVPVCHVFEVEDGLIRRQSVYRNET